MSCHLRTDKASRFNKKKLLIVLWAIVTSIFLSGCYSVLDDLTLIENDTATWFGITPGLTTYPEVFHIMESYPQYDSSSEYYPALDERNGNTYVTYLLDDIYSNVIFGFDESNIVETISLHLYRIKVDDLLTLIGEPDFIFTDKYFEHSLDEDKYNSTLLYEKYHVSAFVLLNKPNKQGLTINGRANVYSLTLYNRA